MHAHASTVRLQNPRISGCFRCLPPAGGEICRSPCTSRARFAPFADKSPGNSTVRMHDEGSTWDFLTGGSEGCLGSRPACLQNGQTQFKQDGGRRHPLPVARHGAHELHGFFATPHCGPVVGARGGVEGLCICGMLRFSIRVFRIDGLIGCIYGAS